jgi:hypothetical protein
LSALEEPEEINRRIPFNPNGRLAAVLKRRAALGPDAYGRSRPRKLR